MHAIPQNPTRNDVPTPDVDVILRRIGIDRRPSPSPENLAVLQRAWVGTIPFENLDIVLGRPINLELPAIERAALRV